MILGVVALLICIFLLLKMVSRKFRWHTVERLLRKIHIPFGFIVIAISVVHGIITLDVWSTRNVMVVGTGIGAAILLVLMAIAYCNSKKLKGKWIALHRRGALLIALLLIGHISIYYVDLFSYKRNITAIEIIGMNASNVKNGTYEGEYDAGYIYAKVSVTVHNEQIANIHILKHDNERGTPAETIAESIIKQQSTMVDAVSKATNSSLVIQKAVENAIMKGID